MYREKVWRKTPFWRAHEKVSENPPKLFLFSLPERPQASKYTFRSFGFRRIIFPPAHASSAPSSPAVPISHFLLPIFIDRQLEAFSTSLVGIVSSIHNSYWLRSQVLQPSVQPIDKGWRAHPPSQQNSRSGHACPVWRRLTCEPTTSIHARQWSWICTVHVSSRTSLSCAWAHRSRLGQSLRREWVGSHKCRLYIKLEQTTYISRAFLREGR